MHLLIANAVLNPVLAWLGDRKMEFVPLLRGHSIVIDTALTSVLLSLLVALFVTSGVHRDLEAGRVTASGFSRKERLLSRLPSQAWALGLMLGFGIAFLPYTSHSDCSICSAFLGFLLRGSRCSKPCTPGH